MTQADGEGRLKKESPRLTRPGGKLPIDDDDPMLVEAGSTTPQKIS
jgi:hypothetical protein